MRCTRSRLILSNYTRDQVAPSRAMQTAVTGLIDPNTPAPMMATWNKMDTISRPKWHCFASFLKVPPLESFHLRENPS